MSQLKSPPSGAATTRSEPARTTFVGRKRECAELQEALRTLLAGRGGLVLLAGEAGIGKTRLADELAAEAARRGVRVAWGRCWRDVGTPAYWPWVQLLRACIRLSDHPALERRIVENAPRIAALLPELDAHGGVEVAQPVGIAALGADDPEGEQFRLFDAVTALLRAAADAAPLVIVFDDAHDADMASLLLLRFFARELRQMPVLLVVTYRETESRLRAPLGDLIAELSREGLTLSLTGLGELEASHLIRDSGGRDPDAETVTALCRITEGNPFYLTEIVRLLVAQGRLEPSARAGLASFEIPDGVRAAVRKRVALASRGAQDVLTVGAVLGREFELPVLRAAAGLPTAELTRALDEAETCGIAAPVQDAAGRYRFAHALIPDTLYHDLQPGRRREIHLVVARTIEEVHGGNLDAHLDELAHHYFSSLPSGPSERAFEYARRGARRAQDLLAYQEAARLYEMAAEALALQRPIDERRRYQTRLRLGEVLYGAGLFDRMRTAFSAAAESARSLGSAEDLARAALGCGMSPLSPYNVDEALVRLLEEALVELPERDSALRAMVLARLASELYWSPKRPRGMDLSARAVEMARRLGDEFTLVYVLYTRHLAAWSLDNLHERLDLATEIVRLADEPTNRAWATRVWGLRAHYFRFADLLELGDIRGVDEEIERYSRLATELRQHLGYEELARATRALMEARFEEAELMAERSLEVAQRLERRARAFRQAVNSHLLILRREQQRIDELEPIFARARVRAPHSVLARCSLAFCLAELGRRGEAAAEFEELAAGGFASLPNDGGRMAMLVLLAEVCTYLADSERAAVLYQMLLPYAERNATLDVHVCYGAVAHYLGILATTIESHSRADEHFARALAMNQEMGARLWAAHTRWRWAQMLRARAEPGDLEKARELTDAALVEAQSLGMRNLAARLVTLESGSVRGETVTILFTDMENSTGITERLGDVAAQELMRTHNAIVREQLVGHHGAEVKSMGDGFMLAFPQTRDATLCAIGIQRAFAAYNRHHPEGPISVAIGLHTGQALREGRDFFGRTVILASRIGDQARGGEILVSSTSRQQLATHADLRFDAGREVELKGFSGQHRLHAVLWA